MSARKMMEKALRTIAVPAVRDLGFMGRFPSFRRRGRAEFQFMMFGFSRHGGSFYVEAGRMSEARFIELQRFWRDSGKELAESALTCAHCRGQDRVRLGRSSAVSNQDHWFTFGIDRFASGEEPIQPVHQYDQIAQQAADAIQNETELFFQTAP